MGSFGWSELLIIAAGIPMLIVALTVMVTLVVFLVRRQRSTSAARKPCPYCAELIKAEAKVCRYCGRDLPVSE